MQQPFGDLAGVLLDVRPGQQYCELIPTQPGRHVAAAHQTAQSLAQRAQQQISGIMAVTVVDRLEVIQIDQQQRDRLTAPRGLGHGRFDPLDEVAPVGQLGQRVVEGGLFELDFPFAEVAVGLRQLGGTRLHRQAELFGAGLDLLQPGGLFPVGVFQCRRALLLEYLDARGQGEGEQDGLGSHRQRKDVAAPGRRLDHAGGAQQQQVDAAQDHAEAAEVEQGGKVALTPAAERGPQRRRDRSQSQHDEDPGAERTQPGEVEQYGRDIEAQGKGQQAVGPGHETAGLQQGLGEAAGAETPERRDADAIQPEGHRSVRPEVLKAMSGHAQNHQQRAAGGHHVPEIGGIAQAEEDEQVV